MTSRALFAQGAARAAPFRHCCQRASKPHPRANFQQQSHRARGTAARAQQTYELELEANEAVKVSVDVPDGAEVYSVALAKPIGIVVEGELPLCARAFYVTVCCVCAHRLPMCMRLTGADVVSVNWR